MSFLGDLSKVLIGRSIGNNSKIVLPGKIPDEVPEPTQSNGLLDERGHKIIPRIAVEGLLSHRNVDNLSVIAWIRNLSDQTLRIDSIDILKQKNSFAQLLRPTESRQLTLYKGLAPHNENEHRAKILYRLQINGDAYQAMYRIGYHYDKDGTREINQLYPDGPVKDL